MSAHVRTALRKMCASCKGRTAVISRTHFGLPLITCVRCHVCTTASEDRSFGAARLRIWNSLPCGLRALDISYRHFKTLLKTYTGWAKKVSLIIFAVTLSAASQFS